MYTGRYLPGMPPSSLRRPSVAGLLLALALGACAAPSSVGLDSADATPPAPAVTAAPTAPLARVTPAAAPSPTPEPAADPATVALQERLAKVLTRPDTQLERGTVAVAVRSSDGTVLLDHAAHTPLLPASTMKLVTAAAALQVYGAEHRFTTTLLRTGRIDGVGTLRGDLVLQAGGDPVLAGPTYGSRVYPARPRTPLEELATRARTAGIRRVAGRVVGDGSGFPGRSAPTGWKDEYFWDFDARHITALTVDAGLVVAEVPITEGSESDAAGAAAGEASDAPVDLATDEAVEPPELVLSVAEDPPAAAAAAATRLLRARGVHVEGEPAAAPAPAAGHVVATIQSPPLATLLRHTVQRSDNHLADTLFRDVGVAVTGDGSWAGAARGVRAALSDLDLDWRGTRLADGSGLSRDDRLTAALLAELDAAMASGPHAQLWAGFQAIAGEAGTLRRRLVGTIGQGRFLGKTGTLDDVMAVAGQVTGPDGARFHVAVIGNDVTGADRTAVRRLMDELVLVLAESHYGCERVHATPSPAVSPTAEPPYSLVCATPPE